MRSLLTVAAAAAGLLGSTVPIVSGTVLRSGWGAPVLAEVSAAAGEKGEERQARSAADVEPTTSMDWLRMQQEKNKPWLASAAFLWRGSVADAPRKVLVRFGLIQTAKQQPSAEPNIDNGADDSEEKAQQAIARAIVGFVSVAVWTALTALIANHYLNNKVHPNMIVDPNAEEALRSFRWGPFDCLSSMDISLWVCCCPAIRWADNVSSLGLLRSFWLAFAVYIGFQMVTSESQDLLAWTVLAVIGAGFRRELRLKFQMARSASTFFTDCLLYCCCPCCAIVQEARQIHEAASTGHPAIVKQQPDEEVVP